MATAATTPAPQPILTLSRSIIRPHVPSDAESLAQAANNPNVSQFLRDIFPNPYTLADAEAWIGFCLTSNPLCNWAIVHPTTGTIMGGISLTPGVDVHSRTAELGYWLGEEYWGRGVMSEAVAGFVDWVFTQYGGPYGVLRIWTGMFHVNGASEKVVQKAGFVFEGRLRHSVVKHGVVLDQLLYSMIREDWERSKQSSLFNVR